MLAIVTLADAQAVTPTAPVGPISGPAARQAAQSELSRTEYHRDDAGLLTRVVNWLGRRLDSVGSVTPGGTATIVVLVLLVAIVVFAILRAGRPGRTARGVSAADPLATEATVDHRRLAEQLEAQGQLAEALREWLRATVATVEQRGVLDPRPGRTGAGVAREAGAAMPSIAGQLNAAVDAFDAVWFGHRPPSSNDLAIARAAADSVRTARLASGFNASGFSAVGYAAPR